MHNQTGTSRSQYREDAVGKRQEEDIHSATLQKTNGNEKVTLLAHRAEEKVITARNVGN
jgi:hypothetical protein